MVDSAVFRVGFRVEIRLNCSETHLHKVYISEHVVEGKCVLLCTQDSTKGQELSPEPPASAITMQH